MIQDYSYHAWRIKGTDEAHCGKELSAPLMHYKPGNLGPFFLIRIIAKKRIIRYNHL